MHISAKIAAAGILTAAAVFIGLNLSSSFFYPENPMPMWYMLAGALLGLWCGGFVVALHARWNGDL